MRGRNLPRFTCTSGLGTAAASAATALVAAEAVGMLQSCQKVVPFALSRVQHRISMMLAPIIPFPGSTRFPIHAA